MARRFHHISTDEVYGELGADDPPSREDSAYAPSSPYAASKASADHLVRAYGRTYGLPVSLSNCANNYGPFQHPEKFVPIVIAGALEERPIPLYGDGRQRRDWLFVEDHVRAIWRIVEQGRRGETYHVAGTWQGDNLEMAEQICDLVDRLRPSASPARRRSLIRFVADRPGHDRRYALNADKIAAELAWRSPTSLAQGLEATVTWYVENTAWLDSAASRPDSSSGSRPTMPAEGRPRGDRASSRLRRASHPGGDTLEGHPGGDPAVYHRGGEEGRGVRGIILAGGSGSRLFPLTRSASKQLLPVYDKPLIYYPLSVLMMAGIRQILLITAPRDAEDFVLLLKDGPQWGLEFHYAVQAEARGLAEAFLIGREFVDDSPVSLILGDNVLYGDGLGGLLRQASTLEKGALIYGYRVRDPQRYGVIELDPAGRPLGLEEKPLQPKSPYAVPGLYFYEAGVVDIAARLQPSARGELEITDVNREYLKRGPLAVQLLGRGYAWLDAGTPEALLQAANFVQALEERQGVRIACVEEIAYCMGYIDAAQLERLSHEGISSGYAAYLRSVLEDEGHGSPRG